MIKEDSDRILIMFLLLVILLYLHLSELTTMATCQRNYLVRPMEEVCNHIYPCENELEYFWSTEISKRMFRQEKKTGRCMRGGISLVQNVALQLRPSHEKYDKTNPKYLLVVSPQDIQFVTLYKAAKINFRTMIDVKTQPERVVLATKLQLYKIIVRHRLD